MRSMTVLAATTLLALGTMSPAGATYEGQEGRIAFGAFVNADRTQGDIWSVRPDGRALRQLTDAQGLRHLPGLLAPTASASRSAATGPAPTRSGSWTRTARTNARSPTSERGRLFPDFSPDGSRIAFSAPLVVGGVTDLWTVTSDRRRANPRHRHAGRGGEAPRVVAGRHDDAALRGRQPHRRPRGQLWTLDVATGAGTQLTFDSTYKDQTPDWSPDGQAIAYHAADDIWLMDADGSDQVNLTRTPSVAEFGTAFSPDGTEISFTGTGGPVPAGERYVQVMAVDGSDRHLVAPTPGLLQAVAAWQPLGAGR